jgi:hypothetical protein
MELPPTDVRFTHTPLNFKHKEIRLLTIEPSYDLESPIQITIKHIDFSSHVHALTRYQEEKARLRAQGHPRSKWRSGALYNDFFKETLPFVALSYTWGPEFPAQDVLVTSPECRGWLPVRQNLYDFLKIRRTCGSTWFWIDQICINQGKDDEKTHQVSQMAEIYSATAVEVWLGSEFEGSNELIDLIVHESALSTQEPCPKLSVNKQGFSTHIPCLRRLLCLPYWSRLWVTQEIVLGKAVNIRVGSNILSWDTFYSGLKRVNDAWGSLDPSWKGMDVLNANDRIYDINRARNDMCEDWWDIWSLASHTECSDVRDKVFGTMGMLHPSLRILPDYSMQPQDVLIMLLPKIVESICTTNELYRNNLREFRGFNHLSQKSCMMAVRFWQSSLEKDMHKTNQKAFRHYLLNIFLILDPPKFGCRTGKVCLLKCQMWYEMAGGYERMRKLRRLGPRRWMHFRSTKKEQAESVFMDSLSAASDSNSLRFAD